MDQVILRCGLAVALSPIIPLSVMQISSLSESLRIGTIGTNTLIFSFTRNTDPSLYLRSVLRSTASCGKVVKVFYVWFLLSQYNWCFCDKFRFRPCVDFFVKSIFLKFIQSPQYRLPTCRPRSESICYLVK